MDNLTSVPNNPIQASPPPAVLSPIESPNRHWLLWSAGGVALLALGIMIGVFSAKFLNQSQNLSQLTSTPTPTLSPTTTPDLYREPDSSAATANWKTYTSEKFGFSFRYPETWKDVSDPKSTTEFKIETASNEVVLGTIFDGKADKAKGKSWIRNLDLINNRSILISYMQCAGMGCKEGSKDIAIFDQILSTFTFLDQNVAQ